MNLVNAMSSDASLSFENARITRRQVIAAEIDELGHVNNAVYVNWIQDAAVEHWQSVATDELVQTYVWICSRHEIDYNAQLFLGEDVEIRTWLGESKGARFERFVEISGADADSPAARARTTWVLIRRETGKPARVTNDILQPFGISGK